MLDFSVQPVSLLLLFFENVFVYFKLQNFIFFSFYYPINPPFLNPTNVQALYQARGFRLLVLFRKLKWLEIKFRYLKSSDEEEMESGQERQ